MEKRKSPGIERSSENIGNTSGTPRALLTIYALIIILHFLGTLFPGFRTWGFNFWSLFPKPISFAILALGLILLIPPVYNTIYRLFRLLIQPVSKICTGKRSNWLIIPVSVILLLIFYFFRSRAYVYGDGFMILNNYTIADFRIENFQAVLKSFAYIFHYLFLIVFSRLTSLPPENIFSLANATGGVVGFWAIFKLTGCLTTDRLTRWFYIISILTGASTILFFGYIEYYTWATAWSLWTLYLAVRYLQIQKGLTFLLIFSILTTGFHLLALPYLLIAIIAIIYKSKKHDSLPFGLSFKTVNISVIFISFVIALLFQIVKFPQWLMLIWPIPDVPYWFMSPARINDILNLTLMVAPLGAIIFIYWIFWKKREASDSTVEEKLLGTIALLTFLVAFWVEPKLGGARDWDFTSFFGFPMTAWGIYRLIKYHYKGIINPAWLVPAVVILMIHLAPNIYEKNNLKLAAANLDRTLRDCPHHQTDYGKARRAMVWGATLYNSADMPEQAIPNFKRQLEAEPSSNAAWFNLGQIYFDKGEYDSSRYFFQQAVKYAPAKPVYLSRLAEAELKVGDYHEAIKHIHQSEQLKPDDYNTQFLYGVLLTKLEKFEDALEHFRDAMRLKPDVLTPVMNMGLLFYQIQNYDSAYIYLNEALRRHPENMLCYDPLIRTNIVLSNYNEARHVLNIYQMISPNAPTLKELEELLRKE